VQLIPSSKLDAGGLRALPDSRCPSVIAPIAPHRDDRFGPIGGLAIDFRTDPWHWRRCLWSTSTSALCLKGVRLRLGQCPGRTLFQVLRSVGGWEKQLDNLGNCPLASKSTFGPVGQIKPLILRTCCATCGLTKDQIKSACYRQPILTLVGRTFYVHIMSARLAGVRFACPGLRAKLDTWASRPGGKAGARKAG
jgi:hypothetical protein